MSLAECVAAPLPAPAFVPVVVLLMQAKHCVSDSSQSIRLLSICESRKIESLRTYYALIDPATYINILVLSGETFKIIDL